jgi:hypothetical protein
METSSLRTLKIMPRNLKEIVHRESASELRSLRFSREQRLIGKVKLGTNHDQILDFCHM